MRFQILCLACQSKTQSEQELPGCIQCGSGRLVHYEKKRKYKPRKEETNPPDTTLTKEPKAEKQRGWRPRGPLLTAYLSAFALYPPLLLFPIYIFSETATRTWQDLLLAGLLIWFVIPHVLAILEAGQLLKGKKPSIPPSIITVAMFINNSCTVPLTPIIKASSIELHYLYPLLALSLLAALTRLFQDKRKAPQPITGKAWYHLRALGAPILMIHAVLAMALTAAEVQLEETWTLIWFTSIPINLIAAGMNLRVTYRNLQERPINTAHLNAIIFLAFATLLNFILAMESQNWHLVYLASGFTLYLTARTSQLYWHLKKHELTKKLEKNA